MEDKIKYRAKIKENVLNLIKNGKMYDNIPCRGGFGATYHHYSFIKTSKNMVTVVASGTWSSYPRSQGNDNDRFFFNKPVARITADYIELYSNHQSKTERKRLGYKASIGMWDMSNFLTIGEFETYGEKILPIKGNYKIYQYLITCENAQFIPQPVMRFDWDGNILNLTSKTKKDTEKLFAELKTRANTLSRNRYKEKKVEREFKLHRKNGTLDQWDVTKVLAIRNVQVRQQAIEEIGMEKVLAPYPTKVLNADTVDGRPYELLEITLPKEYIDIPFNRPHRMRNHTTVCYLKMTNPSTGEYHLESVPRQIDSQTDWIPEETVVGALAWRDGETEIVWQNHERVCKWTYTKPIVLT